jgi:hypothetical protein
MIYLQILDNALPFGKCTAPVSSPQNPRQDNDDQDDQDMAISRTDKLPPQPKGAVALNGDDHILQHDSNPNPKRKRKRNKHRPNWPPWSDVKTKYVRIKFVLKEPTPSTFQIGSDDGRSNVSCIHPQAKFARMLCHEVQPKSTYSVKCLFMLQLGFLLVPTVFDLSIRQIQSWLTDTTILNSTIILLDCSLSHNKHDDFLISQCCIPACKLFSFLLQSAPRL